MSAVTEEKELSKLTSIFHFNGSEKKQRRERSQVFLFNSSESKTV